MKDKLLLYHLLLIVAIFLFGTNPTFSDPVENDSLKVLITNAQNDKEKVALLIKLGDLYKSTNYDSALIYYIQANSISKEQNYNDGIADSWLKQVMIYRNNSKYDSAHDIIEKFIELSLFMNDSIRLSRGFFHYGLILKEMNLNEFSINYCKKSLAITKLLKDTQATIVNYNSIGTVFKEMSVYDSSAFYFLVALKISEIKGDDKKSAILFNNLGDVFLEAEHYTTARDYYIKALEINNKYSNATSRIALNYNNLGRLASAEDHYKEAFGFYDRALDLFMQLNDSSGIYNVYNNYGDLHFKQGKYDLANEYFNKALKGYRNLKFQKGIVTALGNIAAVYINQGKYGLAMDLLDSCINMTYRIGNMELMKDTYWNFSETYNNIGNYQKSRECLLSYSVLKDSIFNLNKTKVINDLMIKYEKEKDQAQILTLEKENLKRTIQRNFFLYGGLSFILLALFSILYLRQRAVKDKVISQQKIHQLEEEKKLMAAKMIVEGQEEERKRIARELHDGLGVLLSATKMQFTTIKDHSPENQPMIKKAIQLLEQASGDVRKISHNMMPGLLTKLGFFEAVEDLFENIHDSGELQALIEIEGEQERLPENKEIMLYRIIQELVNNTLKHAKAKKIKLKIDVGSDNLHLVFEDDGQGFEVEKILDTDSESLGLKSIQSRISFLNGKVTIESKPGEGVKYSMIVPVK